MQGVGEQANGINNDPNSQLPRQVVIPVDCVVPDMPVSMDDDSGQLNTLNQKYASGSASVANSNGTHTTQYMQSMHPSHAHTLVHTASAAGRTNSSAMNGTHPSHASHAHSPADQPVVDLSVPTPHAQPDFIGAGLAPRHGQDIFDTWYVPPQSPLQLPSCEKF